MTQDQKAFDNKLDGTSPIPTAPPIEPGAVHPKQKQAMEIFEKFQKNRRLGVSVNIGNIANMLKGDQQRPTFPEELFLAHFLPLFADEIAETPEVNYSTWIEKIAGGDTKPVDILGADGTVLFTVPPLLDVSIVEQVRPGSSSMTRIERHYSRLKEIDAAASQTFLSKTLQGMHIKDKPTAEVYNNLKTWNAIFERYGRKDKIINLGTLLDHDPNKDAVVLGSGAIESSTKDVGDYDLDTD